MESSKQHDFQYTLKGTFWNPKSLNFKQKYGTIFRKKIPLNISEFLIIKKKILTSASSDNEEPEHGYWKLKFIIFRTILPLGNSSTYSHKTDVWYR